jgi:hypothetical protein
MNLFMGNASSFNAPPVSPFAPKILHCPGDGHGGAGRMDEVEVSVQGLAQLSLPFIAFAEFEQ